MLVSSLPAPPAVSSLEAELRANGFVSTRVSAEAPLEITAPAQLCALSSRAAVVFLSPTRVEVVLRDRACESGAGSLERHQLDEADLGALPVRVAELLRARLLAPQADPAEPPGGESPSEDETVHPGEDETEHPDETSSPRGSPQMAAVALELGGAIGASLERWWAPFGAVSLGASWDAHRWVALALRLELPVHSVTLSALEGSSTQWLGRAVFSVRLPWLPNEASPNDWLPHLGVALGLTYLHSTGEATTPELSRSAVTLVPEARLELGIRWAPTWMERRLQIGAEVHAGASVPVSIRFAQREVQRYGPIVGGLRLWVGWGVS